MYLCSGLFFYRVGINPHSDYLYAKFFTLFHCAMEYLLGDETLGIYSIIYFKDLSSCNMLSNSTCQNVF